MFDALRDEVRCAPDLPAIAVRMIEHQPRYASLARFGLDAARDGSTHLDAWRIPL